MPRFRVALVYWTTDDGIAQAIQHELRILGHTVCPFLHTEPISAGADVVFSFAPYGPFLPLAQRAASKKTRQGTPRPVIVHWNTEGLPDLRLPRSVMQMLAGWRSAYGRHSLDSSGQVKAVCRFPPLSWIDRSFNRYRFMGDYLFAYRQGWLDVYADISAVYACLLENCGLPVTVSHYGSVPYWSDCLDVERDIDVLWMGKYASARRRQILSTLRADLEAAGMKVHFADDEENPFIFGRERTCFLNRSKIVINITRTWYDDNSLRFAIAAPNRALVVSEPILAHCPPLVPGYHYVSAEIDQLVETIRYYVRDEAARQEIVENAHRLYTEELTMNQAIATIMEQATKVIETRR